MGRSSKGPLQLPSDNVTSGRANCRVVALVVRESTVFIHVVLRVNNRVACPFPGHVGHAGIALLQHRAERRKASGTLPAALACLEPVRRALTRPTVSEAPSRLTGRLPRFPTQKDEAEAGHRSGKVAPGPEPNQPPKGNGTGALRAPPSQSFSSI